MPRRKSTKSTSQTVSSSYGSTSTCCVGYHRYADPQSGSSRASVSASTSAVIKGLDKLSSSKASSSRAKGKKRKVEAIGIQDDAVGDCNVETPKPKRTRKKKDSDAPVPEKRGAMFKPRCPQNIMDRVNRVISQRFFLIDRHRDGDELREEFSVLGSTGNVYIVSIDKRPSCTCPDAMKGNHCKHILFVFMKVLHVPQSSHVWYQKALLTAELEEVFRNAPPAPALMANAHVREAYNRAAEKASSSTQVEQARRALSADDYCAICYESMHDARESSLTWCQTCGNALHKECFQQWAKKKSTNLDCVYCRAPWALSGSKSAGANAREGYLNLAKVAGVSPVRDTSTYYHGPRRGQTYLGYQDYDDDYHDDEC